MMLIEDHTMACLAKAEASHASGSRPSWSPKKAAPEKSPKPLPEKEKVPKATSLAEAVYISSDSEEETRPDRPAAKLNPFFQKPKKEKKRGSQSPKAEDEDEAAAGSSSCAGVAGALWEPEGSPAVEEVPFERKSLGILFQVQGYSTTKGKCAVVAGQQIRLHRPPPPPVPKKKAKGPMKKFSNTIIRFLDARGSEVGGLPSEVSSFLAPLLDAGYIAVEAIVTSAPEVLEIASLLLLQIKVFCEKSAFAPPNPRHFAQPEEASTRAFEIKDCLVRLLHAMGHVEAPEGLAQEEADPSNAAAAAAEKQPEAGAEGEAGGGEGANFKVDALLGNSDDLDKGLREMEPHPRMLSSLHPYQKQALGWMCMREESPKAHADLLRQEVEAKSAEAEFPAGGKEGGGGGEAEVATVVCVDGVINVDAVSVDAKRRSMHPMWQACRFPEDQTEFYCNVHSGVLSLSFPHAAEPVAGGILADEMGLGKTVEMLSVIVTRPHPALKGISLGRWQPPDAEAGTAALRRSGATLVVAPMSMLSQWRSESALHMKPGKGQLRVAEYYGQDRVRDVSLFLDYDIVITTYGVLQAEAMLLEDLTSGGGGGGVRKAGAKRGVLHGIYWWRIILDEAHLIKGRANQVSKAAFALQGQNRWAVTGTPLQNSVDDVFGLLHFLRVDPWSDYLFWSKVISKPYERGEEGALQMLQAILQPLLLRRTKDTQTKEGNPIITLPPRHTEMCMLEPSEEERDFYSAIYDKTKTKFDAFVAQGKLLSNYATVLELFLRLRQACDHPFLTMSRSETSQFLDVDKLVGRFLKGSASVACSSDMTKAFANNMASKIKSGEAVAEECPVCLCEMEDPVVTPCAHIMCRECLLSALNFTKASAGGGAGTGMCPVCRHVMSKSEMLTMPSENRFTIDVKSKWKSSCKIDALVTRIQALPQTDKCVVFSQWTAMLDLVQVPLDSMKFNYVRLDGSLSQPQREVVLKRFAEDDRVTGILLSLKAGGVGLNLTTANHVFMLDPWWNPAIEEQAINRIHRIGQVKDVHVTRFIIRDSVEQNLLIVQERKEKLVSGALNTASKEEKQAQRLDDLKILFQGALSEKVGRKN